MDIYSKTIQEIKDLVDLSEIRNKHDVSQYLDRCSKFDLVALGVYAMVYNLPDQPDKVVKVCSSKLDGYHIFARWCMTTKNQNNPHLPVIHREDVITLPRGIAVHYYVIERLSDFTDDGSRATQPRHFHDPHFGILWSSFRAVMQSFGMDNSEFPREIKSLEVFVEKIKIASLQLAKRPDNDISDILNENTIKEYKEFLATLFDVLTQLSTLGAVDLHGGNFMLRGDTVVITDPISHKYHVKAVV